MPFAPGIQDTSGAQFAQGISNLSDYITKHQEEEKGRAREFKAYQELLDRSGIMNKDQSSILDLDTARAAYLGGIQGRKEAREKALDLQAANENAARIKEQQARTDYFTQQTKDLQQSPKALQEFARSYSNLVANQGQDAQAAFDDNAYATGASPSDFSGRPTGMTRADAAAQALATTSGVPARDIDNIIKVLSDPTGRGGAAPYTASGLVRPLKDSVTGEEDPDTGITDTGPHANQVVGRPGSKPNEIEVDNGDGTTRTGYYNRKTGRVQFAPNPVQPHEMPAEVTKSILESTEDAERFRGELRNKDLSDKKVTATTNAYKAALKRGQRALDLARSGKHISAADYQRYYNDLTGIESGAAQPGDSIGDGSEAPGQRGAPRPTLPPVQPFGVKGQYGVPFGIPGIPNPGATREPVGPLPAPDVNSPMVYVLTSSGQQIRIHKNQLAWAIASGKYTLPTK